MKSELFDAVFRADTESVRQLLADGADPDERGANDETPLMAAAREGYVEIISALLDANANPTLEDALGRTALVLAFLAEQEAAARLLLEHGARIDLNLVLHLAYDWHKQTDEFKRAKRGELKNKKPEGRNRPSKLINLPDFREQLIAVAEQNDVHVARETKFFRLEYRRFPAAKGDVVLVIDLHLPDPMPKNSPPLFVFIHGGSWTGGTTGDDSFWLAAKLGFAAASVEYRLTTTAVFPAPVKDCKAAIRFLRSHAWEYGYDPDRVGVLGNSAGGHLALLLGLTPDDPELDCDAGDQNVSSAVQAVCSMSGPADMEAYARIIRLLDEAAEEKDKESRVNKVRHLLKDPHVKFLIDSSDKLVTYKKVPAKMAVSLLESGSRPALLGLRKLAMWYLSKLYFDSKSPLKHLDELNAVSPLWYAQRLSKLPPEQKHKVAHFFLGYGKKDPYVPFAGAEKLATALEEANIPCEFHSLANADHDTSALFPAAFRFLKEHLQP